MKQKKFTGRIELDKLDSYSSFEEKNESNKALPNVLTILLDDVGFAQLGCYGSEIETPNIDHLAAEGLRYNNFHTTAMCSSTRATLLTGANHHSVGICTVTDNCKGEYPNQMGFTDFRYANTAEVLKEYAYTNFMIGKWHLTPFCETTQAGPFTNWPLGRGFDQFYGFLEGYTDSFHPNLVCGNTRIPVPKTPEEGYHLTEDLIDHAISDINAHCTVYPQKPFYMYLALGAAHAPHQAPKEYIEKYKGRFDEGWDVLREKCFLKQKAMGIIPEDAKLSRRNEYVNAWNTLSAKEKKVYARYMEVYAGLLEHTDTQIGRLLQFLDKIGQKDNTLILLLSDNGASSEGGIQGLYNQDKMTNYSVSRDEITQAYEHLDEMGTEYSNMNYPMGWANLGNVPFQWYKTFTHAGGVRDPLIIRYPDMIKEKGAIRTQYHHVVDIAPTILDVLGLEKPESIKGIAQQDYHGISMKYTFQSSDEPTHRHVQYYEQVGNRGIWKDGWKLLCNHMFHENFEDENWELYHTDVDYSEVDNLINEYPEKARELLDCWFIEAGKYGVLPLSAKGRLSGYQKLKDAHQRADQFLVNEQKIVYRNIIEPTDIPPHTIFRARNHTIEIELIRNRKDEGVLYAVGHRFGGYVFYIKNNKLFYTYNCHREKYTTLKSGDLLEGNITITLQFQLLDKNSAEIRLYINTILVDKAILDDFIIMSETRSGIKTSVASSIVDELPFPFQYPGMIKRLELHAAPILINEKEYLENFYAID